MKKKNNTEIKEYDTADTTAFIDRSKKMRLKDLNITLPPDAPTKVLSIRIPTALLNSIKAYASDHDVPYSAMIKILLAESLGKKLRNASSRS